jgi:hypothetical protein
MSQNNPDKVINRFDESSGIKEAAKTHQDGIFGTHPEK